MSLVQNVMGMNELSKWLLTVRKQTELKLQARGLPAAPPEALVQQIRLQHRQREPLGHQHLLLLEAASEGAELLLLGSSSITILLLGGPRLGPLSRRVPLCIREMAKMKTGLIQLLIRVQRKDRIREHSASDPRDAGFSLGGAQRQQQAVCTRVSGDLKMGGYNEAHVMAV